MLLENPVSYVTGFNGGIVNLGEVENRGFELELRTRNIVNPNFKWSSTLILSTNQNELISFGESNGALLEDGFGRNSQWINLEGHPISSFYGFVVDEELPTDYYESPYIPINGRSEDVIVKDLNGDGLISDADKTILGDPYPDLIWSFTNDFEFGQFDFSVMIQEVRVLKLKILETNILRRIGKALPPMYRLWSTRDLYLMRTFLQERVLTNDVVQSASYFSLRNVNFGYNFKREHVSKIGLEGIRLYVTGQNLVYITSDEYKGFNPEYFDTNNSPRALGAQRAGTPLFRTMSIGLNVNF